MDETFVKKDRGCGDSVSRSGLCSLLPVFIVQSVSPSPHLTRTPCPPQSQKFIVYSHRLYKGNLSLFLPTALQTLGRFIESCGAVLTAECSNTALMMIAINISLTLLCSNFLQMFVCGRRRLLAWTQIEALC